jgi:hypothetical protein
VNETEAEQQWTEREKWLAKQLAYHREELQKSRLEGERLLAALKQGKTQ